MSKILKRRPGDPCCLTCANMLYESREDTGGMLWSCCGSEGSYRSYNIFTVSSFDNTPGGITFREILDQMDFVLMHPGMETTRDANGDGFVDSKDWRILGWDDSQMEDLGNWIFDGGRALLSISNLYDYYDFYSWYYEQMNLRLAILGSSMQISEDQCREGTAGGGADWQVTSDFNTNIGFPLTDPVMAYMLANKITGGTWMFNTLVGSSTGCEQAFPVMSVEKIGAGLLAVCGSDWAVNNQLQYNPHHLTNCPAFNAILKTPIEDLTC